MDIFCSRSKARWGSYCERGGIPQMNRTQHDKISGINKIDPSLIGRLHSFLDDDKHLRNSIKQ